MTGTLKQAAPEEFSFPAVPAAENKKAHYPIVKRTWSSRHRLQRPLRWTGRQVQIPRVSWQRDDLRAVRLSRRQMCDRFSAVYARRREDVAVRHGQTEYVSTAQIAILP